MSRVAILALLLAATAAAQGPPAAPPPVPKAAAVTVPGADSPRPAMGAPVVCPLGRFVPLCPTSADPLAFDVSDPSAVTLDVLPVGTPLYGVKFDEPAGARAKLYRFPDAKGPVALLLPERDVTVSIWKNGEGGGPPVKVQTLVISVSGPRPPPGPPDPPKPPPGPPLTAFQVAVRAAVMSDTATAAQVLSFASLYRAAAGQTVASAVTTGDVVADIRAAAEGYVAAGKIVHGSLHNTAKVIEPELSKVINPPATMDDARRAVVKAKLLEIANALEVAANGK